MFRRRKFPAPRRSSRKLLVLAMGFGTVPLLTRGLRSQGPGSGAVWRPMAGPGCTAKHAVADQVLPSSTAGYKRM
ncbi:hypothetical protein GCM10018953_24390 [Streptosporangium nondiastaticum]